MRLKADGYRLVHLVAREALTPLGTYDKEFTARLETHAPDADGRPLGLVGSFAPATPSAAASTPVRAAAGSALPVTRLQPAPSAPAR